MANILTQEEMVSKYLPLIKNGKTYIKFAKVWARPAMDGELIETITSDGKETKNTAEEGDIVVRALTEAQEKYIIKSAVLAKRYYQLEDVDGEWGLYQAKGEIYAIEVTEENLVPSFVAAWGQEMVCKVGDFYACPTDGNEVYRIARKEFFETYEEK